MVQHVTDLTHINERQPTFLAIGSFDGVHRGHQTLLQQMVAAARLAGARAAALTFFPHPSMVIRGERGRFYISTLEERVALLAEQGLDLVITHPFDEAVRQTRAADFVERLCRALDLRQLWGGNFALGYNREGDIPFLRRLGEEKGYTVQVVKAMVKWEGEIVSSSRIRRAVGEGNVVEANGCLGRPLRLSGTVVRGDGRGRSIGIPTANIRVWEERVLPANGVYATYAWVGQRCYQAATNVGVRPTVDGQTHTVESHLLDFDGDLYGQELKLDFIGRIRDEQKFPNLDALVAQIRADIEQVRGML